jgi:hypothetical protein
MTENGKRKEPPMHFRMILIFLTLFTLCACTSITNLKVANEFDTSSQKYNRMLRWHEMEMAGLRFADQSVKDEYISRAKAAKGVLITDYRVEYQECSPEKGEATVDVNIDYYIPPSVTLKTLEDVQKWKYVGDEGNKSWRLMSLPPEFK